MRIKCKLFDCELTYNERKEKTTFTVYKIDKSLVGKDNLFFYNGIKIASVNVIEINHSCIYFPGASDYASVPLSYTDDDDYESFLEKLNALKEYAKKIGYKENIGHLPEWL